jgi:ABC-type phosphate transport system auxiliary subunit
MQLLFLSVPLHLVESFMARVGLTWTKLVFGLVATLTLGVVALEYFYPEPDYESEEDDEDESEPALSGDAVASNDFPSSSNESALSP